MAAVSVMRMRTGSYAHIIALINFGTRNRKSTFLNNAPQGTQRLNDSLQRRRPRGSL